MKLEKQTQAFFVTTILLRVFYVWFARLTLAFLPQYDNYYHIARKNFDWPLFWGSYVTRGTMLDIIVGASFVSFMLVLFKPGWRVARIFVAYMFLCQLDVEYIYGDVGHASHAYFWLLFVLCLAPSWRPFDNRREIRQRVLQNFFFAQATLGFFYTLSGIGKVYGAISQLVAGEISTLHWTGMSRIIAARLLTGNTNTQLGPFLVEHPMLAYPGFWITVFLEVAAFWVAFRPKWHFAWGTAMIVFHLLVTVSLSPNFSNNLFLIFLLFVLSPITLARANYANWDLRVWNKLRNGFQRNN